MTETELNAKVDKSVMYYVSASGPCSAQSIVCWLRDQCEGINSMTEARKHADLAIARLTKTGHLKNISDGLNNPSLVLGFL